MKRTLFTLALSIFLVSALQAAHKSKTEVAIDANTTGNDIRTATPDQVDAGAKATIAALPIPGVSAQTIVTTALIYAPAMAPDLAGAGLANVQADVTLTLRARQSEAAAIVKATMNAVLLGSRTRFPGGVMDKSDGAADVTAHAVNAVKNSSDLFTIVVSTAVKTAQNQGSGVHSGAGGVVTGAISQVAGTDNADVTTTNGHDNDALVLSVITTAAKTAPHRLNDIANAVGYAFAGTFLATKANGHNVDASTFLATNKARLLQALTTDANSRKRYSAAVLTALGDQLSAGVALAYAGLEGAGDKGVGEFTYNNGSVLPVTDTQGL